MELQRVYKQGGSYALVLPKRYLVSLNILPGDYVRLDLISDTILINKVDLQKNPGGLPQKQEVAHAGPIQR
jgi:antitoxin component of MazEF toxin-antitoxin module